MLRMLKVGLAVTALVVVAPQSLLAGVDEVRLGVSAQGVGGYSPDKEQGVAINAEALVTAPAAMRIIGAPRPHIGVSVATDSDATSYLYAGLEWKLSLARRLFVTAAGGGAVHNGETETFDPVADASRFSNTTFLGCRGLFRIGAGVGYDLSDRLSASVSWSHISNAGLCDDNEGLDTLGLRFGRRF